MRKKPVTLEDAYYMLVQLKPEDRDKITNSIIEGYINGHTNKDLMAVACVLVKTIVERVDKPEEIDQVCSDIAKFTKMYFEDPDKCKGIFE